LLTGSHATAVWQDAQEFVVAIWLAGLAPTTAVDFSDAVTAAAGGRTACLSREV
jgi:hypothetical protein